MRLFISVTAYGGSIKNKCASSLLNLQLDLTKRGIAHDIQLHDLADIVLVRNWIASKIHGEKQFTHLLFVDSDMDFPPAAVRRMLEAKLPVVGATYPRRKLPIEFAVRHIADNVSIKDGLCPVVGVGMGLCLIDRCAFDAMVKTGKLRTEAAPDKALGINKLYGFFDNVMPDGSYLAEDYAFCERWRTLCNGTVTALVDADIGHIGEHNFKGNYFKSLQSRAKQTP